MITLLNRKRKNGDTIDKVGNCNAEKQTAKIELFHSQPGEKTGIGSTTIKRNLHLRLVNPSQYLSDL